MKGRITMPNATLRLFHSYESSSSWRVRIVLALKRLDYDSVLIGLDRREHQQDSFLKVNPIGQVPTLCVDGQYVSQSVAISEYLDETYPHTPLLPEDRLLRARVREFVEVINAGIQPLNNGGLNHSFRERFSATDTQIRAWKNYWIQRRLAGLETKLKPLAGQYCAGESLSLADVFLFPQIDRARSYDVDTGQFPTIHRIYERLGQSSEFVETGTKPTSFTSTSST
jgi:maleylacetoacetate isomerase